MTDTAILQKFATAVEIPIELHAGDGSQLFFHSQTFLPNIAHLLMEPYIGGKYPQCYLISPDYIMAGYLAISEDTYLILGPASPTELWEGPAKRTLQALDLPAERWQELQRSFNYIPQVSSTKFLDIMAFLQELLCPHAADELIHVTYQVKHDTASTNYPTSTEKSDNLDSEIVIRQMVRAGDYQKLQVYYDGLLTENSARLPHVASTNLRSAKNIAIGSIAITTRLAIEAGVPYHTAITLSDYYIAQVERCDLFATTMELNRAMILDFTKRISYAKHPPFENATIEAAYHYIQEHLDQKISVQDIAGHLGYNASYFSDYFHKHTGKTLSRYINELKIQTAKYELRETGKSLGEIAGGLAFSSQQQFQNTFKKIAGETPLHYRNTKLS